MKTKQRLPFLFFCGMVLLAIASEATAQGQEQPIISLRANAPGWITVYWEHTGKDVYSFIIQRQDPPYSDNNIVTVGQSVNNTDSIIDKNLRADTSYNYRVCAIYAYSRACSDWQSARTLPLPPASSGGSSSGTPARPKHELRTPNLTATSNGPLTITLHWGSDSSDLYTLGNVQLYRDGQITYDSKKYGGFVADYQDGSLRANAQYTYKVCFIGFSEAEGDTKCSAEIAAMGQPVTPTALANVNISKSMLTRGVRNANSRLVDSVRIRTVISATWRNTDVPGEFITLERENKVQLDRMRVGPAWDEIARISAKSAPTEASTDITPNGPELGTQHLNNYRVCTVVPALKSAGKVCSAPVSVQ
ncbi:MAG TPA: fibronectin type III domain-containing protein [Pyrinomonadaceae bacterium]